MAKDSRQLSPSDNIEVQEKLGWGTITAYGAPGVGAGYMFLLLSLYVMKFATDVLLIAPAVMGTIFGISRIWDAISDPLVGYLSDRTTHRLGRRRLWLIISILPIALTFVMVFSPPIAISGSWLSVWMAVGIITFYSAMTVFIVPHMSLGAELTPSYHERSRLYGLRHVAFTIGSILAVASMQLFINAEREGPLVVRETALNLSVVAAVITAILIAYAVVRLRERDDFQGRITGNPYHAFRDVWRNHHARLLILVSFVEQVGGATIGVLTLYVAAYVVGNPMLGPAIILTYMIPSTISVPLWLPLSRRFGKIRLWMFSMIVTAISFGSLVFLPFVELESRSWMIFIAAVFAGSAAGCGGTIGPSVQSDIIDYDEYKTGERKEGSYFAVWNFVYKCATGVMVILTGYVLQFSGFVPNQEQTMQVMLAIVFLYGLFPFVCYLLGAWLFSRFTLGEEEYVRIRLILDQRNRDLESG
jgi:GPH family glycoside/pentoside/hexuronide:cation symporter